MWKYGGRNNRYNGPYGKVPSKKDCFIRLVVHLGVNISAVQVKKKVF